MLKILYDEKTTLVTRNAYPIPIGEELQAPDVKRKQPQNAKN